MYDVTALRVQATLISFGVAVTALKAGGTATTIRWIRGLSALHQMPCHLMTKHKSFRSDFVTLRIAAAALRVYGNAAGNQ